MHGGVEKPGEEQPPVMGQAVSCFVIFAISKSQINALLDSAKISQDPSSDFSVDSKPMLLYNSTPLMICFLQDIHKKICSLNFRDCHAKIRQVDSQATVGSAVVVQVGEHGSCL